MTAIVRVFSRAFSPTSLQAEGLKQLALICGASLFVLLLSATYGLDLSPGFF
jgi:hypothetical protein